MSVLASALERITQLPDDALVLDVGAWASPMPRADWVIDLFPYATRGMYDYDDAKRARERFTEQTWVVADICASEPWPFADDQFDFSVCSQTLEDVRDPIRVCEQLVRVSKAGYIEVPAPVEDLTWGIHGPWVGWSHHHWICELEDGVLAFNMKPHLLCADGRHHPAGTCDVLSPEERVLQLWWDGSFGFKENVRVGADDFDAWLGGLLDRTRTIVPEASETVPPQLTFGLCAARTRRMLVGRTRQARSRA